VHERMGMGLASRSHKSVRKREEGRGKGCRKRPRIKNRVVKEFGYGPKLVRMGAEHEN
jgi:hypothetical protein